MRLDYFIAHATGLPRKKVKILISKGAVRVAGVVRPTPALKLADDQAVWLEKQLLHLPLPRYLMLNKPVGVVCSTDDPQHRTVLDLLAAEQRSGLHVAGRLDIDTTGLVLLTDDGQWSHRLTSPRHACQKRYRVSLAEPISEVALEQLRHGVQLKGEDQLTRPAQVEVLEEGCIALTIQEGRYHQVKRMLAAVGNHVTALHREAIGAITLDASLGPGDYRVLGEEEVRAVVE